MNKILTLYDIEFKRIYKLYFALLALLFAGNIAVVWKGIHNVVNLVATSNELKPTIGLLKYKLAEQEILSNQISNSYHLTTLILGFSVIFCLIYAVAIWYRDIFGKSRTSYTLFMLPINKFNMYISKALTVIVMIYGITLSQILSWIVEVNLVSSLSGVSVSQILEKTSSRAAGIGIGLVQFYPIDFIMINIIGVILAVVVIFTGVMLQRAFNKKGIVFGGLYIFLSIAGYLFVTSKTWFTDRYLLYHFLYYIMLFVLSVILSYRLLNKKVYL